MRLNQVRQECSGQQQKNSLRVALQKKDLGVLMDKKLDTCHQCVPAVQKANSILGYNKRGAVSRGREGTVSLCSALVSPLCASRPGVPSSGAVGARPEEGHEGIQKAGAPLL